MTADRGPGRFRVDELPVLGVGIGWRRQIHDDLVEHRNEIDFVELLADDFLDEDGLERLASVNQVHKCVLHGTRLSLGTAGGLDESHLRALATIISSCAPPWWSDHLAFTRAGGIETDSLQPLWFTSEAVTVVVANVRSAQLRIPDPALLLENIAYYVEVPGAEMTEAEFITRVLVEADVGMLLDVSNLHVNAANLRYDPYAFLNAIPLERVVQVHLGGSRELHGLLFDSHADPVAEDAWVLLEYVLQRAPVRAVSLERDGSVPPFRELMDELQRARAIWRRAQIQA